MTSSQIPPLPTAPVTTTDRVRRYLVRLIDPATRVLAGMGVTPNTLTLCGALLNLMAGLMAASGNLAVAGLVWLVAGMFDGLDGALARRIGMTNKFGAFLDSTLDRYSDSFVLFGILIYAGDRGLVLETRLVFITLVGSLLVSYTRARAEGLGIDCKVGLLTRLERFLIVTFMLIAGQITVGLVVLAALTHLTVVQRMIHVWLSMRHIDRASEK